MDHVRAHQRQMDELADQLIAGLYGKRSITLDCTPGGGKTGAGTLLANRLLDADVIDSVLWVVPRLSLAEQVTDAFLNGFGARRGRHLEVVDGQDHLFAENLPHMSKLVGCVTTYQSIANKSNYKRFRDAIVNRRTLIIFDEVQFLNLESNDDSLGRGWYAKVSEVKEAAAFALFMSGTLWRTDNRRIPFIEYEKRSDGRAYPLCDISYSLRQAVTERAVLPIDWKNRGGVVEYNYNGDPHIHDLLAYNEEEESRKVRAFLSGEKAVGRLLDDMVDDWRGFCRRTYQSRMIVMSEDIKAARRWREWLQKRHDVSCVLATSKEEAAGRQLRHFRERRHGQCLVTVAMAYVGFDCPDLTHLAYLTPTRAPSWMLQSFARISRYDRNAPVDYDHQHGFIFAPDDEAMRRFCTWLRTEEDKGIKERRSGGNGETRTPPVIEMPDDFEPIAAEPGGLSIESLHRRLAPAVVEQLDAIAARCPAAADIPRSKLYEILAGAGHTFNGAEAAR